MAKLEGKLPFTNAIYRDIATGKLIKVVSRERKQHSITINVQHETTGAVYNVPSETFYDVYKRCKEGTAFHIEEGWNE